MLLSDGISGPEIEPSGGRSLIDRAPVGLVLIDHRGRIRDANATLAGWLGQPEEAILDKPLSSLMTVPGRMFWETHLAPLLMTQGAFEEIALDLVCADGTRLAVTTAANSLGDGAGDTPGFSIAFMKAGQRRRYERDLLAAKASGEAAQETLLEERETSELREQFIAVLGHDLRNPLMSLNAGMTILRRQAPEELGTLLTQMQRSSRRMEGLINDVLDFARGRLGGGIAIAARPADDLPRVLGQVVEELQQAHPDRSVQITIACEGAIRSDPVRIAQLASNLLANAMAHGDPEQPVLFSAVTLSDHLEVAVSNTGRPIPEAIRPRLFQPFNRHGSGEVREGLGLGLYIASQIALAHNGELTVSSDETETRFLFRMPI